MPEQVSVAMNEIAADMRARLYAFRRATKDLWLELDFQGNRMVGDPNREY